jgi:hypothetical protein
MFRLRIVLVAGLCIVPGLATAQRGGAGGSGAKRIEGSDPTKTRLQLATRSDFEDLSPAAFLRDKRKKLQLGDAEVNALKAAESAAKERNKPVLAAYDSVRREMQKLADSPNIGDNANDAALRQMAFANLMGRIRDARTADRTEALAAIPADKKDQADALLKEQDEEFDKKVGAGGRGGRRGGL